MSYALTFANSAQKVMKKWKKSNPTLFCKTASILEELIEHPRTGTGHPEPLRGCNGITYSRHISAHDRIIYDIFDDRIEVHVIEVGGHYDDK